MFSAIVANEECFNELLPTGRLQNSVPTELIAAGRKWSAAVWETAERSGPVSLTDEQITDGLRLAQNPVFICGVHRSGTTLLKDILDGHPGLVVLPSEGTFYTNIEHKLIRLPRKEWAAFLGQEWLRRLANPINQPPYWLLGRSNEEGSPYVDFARHITAWWNVLEHKPGTQWPHMAIVLAYASCTNNLPAKYWVDKTPTNERYLDRIWREMPAAKIIHMVREPVATLTSRRQMEPNISLYSALKLLKTSFTVASQPYDPRQYLVIRYEDLCNQSERKTQQIADFLGIEAVAALSQPSVGGKASQANSSFGGASQPGQILKPDQHKQISNLTENKMQLIATVMYKPAKRLGYNLQHMPFISGLILKLKHLIRLKK